MWQFAAEMEYCSRCNRSRYGRASVIRRSANRQWQYGPSIQKKKHKVPRILQWLRRLWSTRFHIRSSRSYCYEPIIDSMAISHVCAVRRMEGCNKKKRRKVQSEPLWFEQNGSTACNSLFDTDFALQSPLATVSNEIGQPTSGTISLLPDRAKHILSI